MAREPDLTIPDVPLTVIARVYAKGDPLGGNICPPVRPVPIHANPALLRRSPKAQKALKRLWQCWRSEQMEISTGDIMFQAMLLAADVDDA